MRQTLHQNIKVNNIRRRRFYFPFCAGWNRCNFIWVEKRRHWMKRVHLIQVNSLYRSGLFLFMSGKLINLCREYVWEKWPTGVSVVHFSRRLFVIPCFLFVFFPLPFQWVFLYMRNRWDHFHNQNNKRAIIWKFNQFRFDDLLRTQSFARFFWAPSVWQKTWANCACVSNRFRRRWLFFALRLFIYFMFAHCLISFQLIVLSRNVRANFWPYSHSRIFVQLKKSDKDARKWSMPLTYTVQKSGRFCKIVPNKSGPGWKCFVFT